jgi:hypothetical protein
MVGLCLLPLSSSLRADSDAPDVAAIFGSPPPAQVPQQSDEPDVNAIFGAAPAPAAPADTAPGEPDLGSIFGSAPPTPAQPGEPDLGSIFGDATPPSSGEPDIGGIFEAEAAPAAAAAAPAAADERPRPVGPMPTNLLGQMYYVLDFAPRYVQHYLRYWPNDALGSVHKYTGFPTQHEEYPLELGGFVEGRAGFRVLNDPTEKRASLGELRFQTEAHKTWAIDLFEGSKIFSLDTLTLNYRGDLLGDFVMETAEFDLREANAQFSPFPWADVKIGRQILTWGVGDLLFINDLFPKDWQSFLIGRDVEYLKAPSDALKWSIFTKALNVDTVYVPRFNPDRYIFGERVSFFNPAYDRRVGEDEYMRADVPDQWFIDDEWHVRAYNSVPILGRNYMLAGYFYHGFWKSPGGIDPNDGHATFPHLNVYGASFKGPLWKGILSGELGYYDSIDDRDGMDPFVNNSELRMLVGYEQNLEQQLVWLLGGTAGRFLGRDLTVGAQYYNEWITQYENYRDAVSSGIDARDQVRHLTTFRVTKLLLDQDLELSLFTFFSPSDVDAYMRPHISYRLTDHWSLDAGANIFFGRETHTFFNQFEKNTSLYFGVRCSF